MNREPSSPENTISSTSSDNHDSVVRLYGTILGLGYEAGAIAGLVSKNYVGAGTVALLGAAVLGSTYSNEIRTFIDNRLHNSEN